MPVDGIWEYVFSRNLTGRVIDLCHTDSVSEGETRERAAFFRGKAEKMASYESFARVYDLFMDNIPYGEWSTYLRQLLLKYDVQDGLVLELGCGTGSMTELLAGYGYDMIGLDNSVEMLEIAREKKEQSGHDILYLLQDMREFELYGTVKAVVSVCDSMNYITDPEDLLTVFKLVNNYLDPGGVFIFDMNTIYKYEELLGDTVIAENREESSFIWENWYDSDERINEYDLTLFIRREDGLYEKYEETHYQKAYEISEICRLLKAAGLRPEAVYNAFTTKAPEPDSERVYFVAREQTKQKKHLEAVDYTRGRN